MRHRAILNVQATLTLAVMGLPGVVFAADEIHWTITGPTSVTFDWRGSAAENTIAYGLGAGSYTSTVTAASPTGTCIPFSSSGPFWEAKLTGLSADSLYHYSIANGPDHTFRTPPPSGASDFELLVEGDIGDSAYYPTVAGVQQLMSEESGARFVLVVGDLTYADDHGLNHCDLHFNDVMRWSRDVAYMPAWGNHDWDNPPGADDLRNYKGRFDLPNPRRSVGTPAVSDCGEDWYWFDYGNVRFIALPEPWTGAWADWRTQATSLMDFAQADPGISWIVTFGHRPAYSSGHHAGSATLQGYLGGLAASHSKYVLDLNGHSHNYERTFPQNGLVHVTVGTGGSSLGTDGSCLWLTCEQPSWSAVRYLHLGYLKLHVMPNAIEGAFVCGPAGAGENDITCTPGSVIDSFVIVGPCNDSDDDGYGDPGSSACSLGAAKDCNDSNAAVHPDAAEACNAVDDDCDGQTDEDASGVDSDGDGVHNACDNCIADYNPLQSDRDHDKEGDLCDLNDGLIYIYSTDKNRREWKPELGYATWNSYRGSLAVLRATGQYTQAPGSNPLAARNCGLSDPYVFDPVVPKRGEVAFHLVTGVAGGIESHLGTNSAGVPRANANPCP